MVVYFMVISTSLRITEVFLPLNEDCDPTLCPHFLRDTGQQQWTEGVSEPRYCYGAKIFDVIILWPLMGYFKSTN